MILKLFKGIKRKELKYWRVIYPEIGCKKIPENGRELNPCSHHGHPDYKHNMVLENFIEMAEILMNVKGKFILSINDHPEMRKTFKSFSIKPVSLLYSVGKKPTKGKELIISK